MRLSLLALLVVSLPAVAQTAPDDRSGWNQTERGVRILGGSASLARFRNTTSVRLSPRVGVFVADRLALSTSLTLGYSRTRSEDSFDEFSSSSLQLGVGPTATYYVTDGGAVRPFVEGGLSLSYSWFDLDRPSTGGATNSDVTVGGQVQGGVEVPIARNVALRGAAFYQANDLTFENNIDSYGLFVGFSTFLY